MNKKSIVFVFLVVSILICSLTVIYFVKESENKNTAEVVLFGQQEEQRNLLLNLDEGLTDVSSITKSKNSEIELISDEESSLKVNSEEESEKIFKRAGEEYIMRDEGEYKVDPDAIKFNPTLPSSICVDEKIDIAIEGKLKPSLNYLGYSVCLYSNVRIGIDLEVKIMEDDLAGDDEIAKKYLYISQKCNDLEIDYSHIFEDIKFSDYFGGVEGNTIEVYAIVKLTSDYTNNLEYSTSDYDIDKDSNCECMQGDCCDLSTHKFKSSGSQPTGKSDEYYCSGTSSPTGTSYIKKTDYYCSGSSASVYSRDTTKDTCGTCKYCESGYSSCKNYDSSTICGSNKHCDGSGSCISCGSHSSASCYDNDIYWFDDCGNREDKKTECGENTCSSWINFCKSGNELGEKRICYSKGCSGSSCYSNEKKEEKFIQTCSYKCEEKDSNAGCVANPNIECSADSHCKKTGYLGDAFCLDRNVYRYQITGYSCINPGKTNSYCDYQTLRVNTETCEYGCIDGKCKDAPKPDLTVDDLVVQNINGNEVVLGFTIKNVGEIVANSVLWMVDTGPSDANPKRTSFVSLEPNGFTRAFMILDYSKSGTYSPKVIVDFDNIVKESDENNNEASISVKV